MTELETELEKEQDLVKEIIGILNMADIVSARAVGVLEIVKFAVLSGAESGKAKE